MTPVEFDEPSGEGETQAGTLALLQVAAVDLAELLEDLRMIFWGYADAGVPDCDQELAMSWAVYLIGSDNA